jgi:haloalkane dehalogenase
VRTVHLPGLAGSLRFSRIPGSPPAVVFLTGMGPSALATFLTALPPRLLGERDLIFVDPFGSGFSDAPETFSYSLAEHAETVAALLDQLAVEASDIVGFSMGGSIAVVLADAHPRLVRGVVAAEANLDQGGGTLSPRIAGQTEAQFTETGHTAVLASLRAEAQRGNQGVAAMFAFLTRVPSHALYRNACALVQPLHRPVRERLEHLTTNKIYIAGSLPDAEYPGLGGPLTNTPTIVVRDAGHLLMWDNPDGWAAALDAALIHLNVPRR